MKKHAVKSCWFLLGLAILFSSCPNKVEHDARSLATIHKQRVEMIHRLLKTHDSSNLAQYRNELLLLDAEYDQLQANYYRKYNDSASREGFDMAFKEALRADH